ncbi:ABC transporter permease [Caulobacter sp. S45]|uniref:ABC transporter permease n=1 Tax=Caulobacter sp. S45 TaxID=1641861 RepID=UPI001C209D91|nr:ABC transporter permease [Caulobacter sp. S45]
MTLYRSLSRHRLYAVLNVFGLAVGIAVFLLLWLDVRFETGFERWIPHADQIYEINGQPIGPQSDGRPPIFATMGGLLDELRGEFTDLVGTRISGGAGTLRLGSQFEPRTVSLVDKNFFDVFPIPLVEGNRATALAAPDGVVLTRSEATRDFGSVDPLGRSLTLLFNRGDHVYRVTGVIADPPTNTNLDLDLIIPLHIPTVAQDPAWYTWGTMELTTYLRFPNASAARSLEANLDGFTDRHGVRDFGTRHGHTVFRLRVAPLLSVHLRNPKDAIVVASLGAVGVLTLLLAVVNYVNLATARAGLRAREVAVRKVMGATQPALMAQFMGEAIATTALGALIGLALFELVLPLLNAAAGLSLKIVYLGPSGLLPVVLALVTTVGLSAGLYPALILSRYRPAAVLASARTPGGGRAGTRVREGLVVLQFGVAIAFTVATSVILAQTQFLRQADVGFRREGLITVKSFEDSAVTDAQRASLLEAWRAVPGVTAAAAGDIGPGDEDSNWNTNTRRDGQPAPGPAIFYVRATPGFFTTYGARLLAGRLPDRNHGEDFSVFTSPTAATGQVQSVVLNVAAARALGFARPQAAVGQPLINTLEPGVSQRLTVIAVVSDIRFRSPRDPVPPTAYLSYTGPFPQTSAGVRYSGTDSQATMNRLQAVWRTIVPSVPFRAHTAKVNLERYYRPDDRNGRLFVVGAVLAVAIGCVGLYGLASFNTARRTREIGIRKTLGASTADVLRLLIGQFLRPVLLANLIAWPLAWLAMRSWLTGFDQRINLGPQYFLGATLLTLLVALLTVVGQALRVARAVPSKALRYE